MKEKILIGCLLCCSAFFMNAQTDSAKIKLTGYVQTQFQWGEEDASLKVGAVNEDKTQSFNRIGIRRGRMKLTYEEKLASVVFQVDVTEKGVGLKDAYFAVKEPWAKA
ncbi:MAG: hypothetical protein LBE91_06695, partial [Tannerella sp.]|nr:hypothetical protein [Tannerella sp.]